MLDISVVIPLYRAVEYLPRLLASLAAQTFPADQFEVVLVDDASPDDTAKLAERLLIEQPGLTGRVVRREINGGVSAARNSGWQAARAPLIVFIDQDCLADPELLAGHWQMHATQPEGRLALAGKIVWSAQFQENPASEYYKATYFPSWDTFQPGGPNFHLFITSNASVSRAGLVEAGGFDEAFRHNYDDVSCGHRLERIGYRIELCPAALVYHNRPLPIEEMFRRTRLAGREMARFFQHYPELIGHWWLLNPAQAFYWADHLPGLPALLDALPASALSEHASLFETAANFILQNPLAYVADPLLLRLWQARAHYQQDISLAKWSGTAFRLQTTPVSVGVSVPARLAGKLERIGFGKILSRRDNRAGDGPPTKIEKMAAPGRALLHKEQSRQDKGVKISVLTQITKQTDEFLWHIFVVALGVQTLDPGEFELVVAVPPRLSFPLDAESLAYKVKIVTVANEKEGWAAASQLASGSLVVLLPVDGPPVTTLLETYQKAHRPGVVLVSPDLPLAKPGLTEDEDLPDLAGFEPGMARALHFSAYRLENSCLGRDLFRQVVTTEFSGAMADLVTGWRLAQEQGARLESCPTAPAFGPGPRRLAQRLLGYVEQTDDLARLPQLYPTLARQMSAIDRLPPTTEQLHFLYEILKEYPFFLGLLEGLESIFGITDLAGLRASPLFGPLVEKWEVERKANLTAQLAALEKGQAELDEYLRRF